MSQPAPQEIEAKFLIGDPAVVAPLRTATELTPTYPLQDVGTVEMVDEYLDTPDLRLLRQGYGLRIRTSGEQQVVTLKSRRITDTASIYRRMEIEEPLPADATVSPISGWPEGVMQTLMPLLDGATCLAPLCRLEQTRQKRMILGERRVTPNRRSTKQTTLAELSFDDVRVRVDGEGPTLAHYGELEIELARGLEETELHAIVAAFQAQLSMEPSPVSKLEHALNVIGRHPAEAPENWQGMQADMHMAEACRLIWREQLTEMLLNEAGVRFSSNPEYVHDMRVATRRRALRLIYMGTTSNPRRSAATCAACAAQPGCWAPYATWTLRSASWNDLVSSARATAPGGWPLHWTDGARGARRPMPNWWRGLTATTTPGLLPALPSSVAVQAMGYAITRLSWGNRPCRTRCGMLRRR